ncbi:hypothetical protein FHS50_001236 [Sphingomicrobium lutaoense]|uniref:DUF2155 domain-containing protein n=1 Tax=Sphingomicrobium lutaoense TaxID=515949 RepID=A0A839Z356_9SPHN|nr:hypothetical protein [Sphingomicrobium lutaoense]
MKPGSLNKPFLLALAALTLGACDNRPPERGNVMDIDTAEDSAPEPVSSLEGVTPLAERVAVLGFLNKRNGLTRDLEMRPGQLIRIGEDVIVRLRACETTAPWESQQLTGAFVQVDVKPRRSNDFERIFSGWLYKESPSLNVVEHPVYDVWVKSCTMSWPDGPSPPAGVRSSASSSSRSNDGGEATPAEEAPAPEAPADTPAPPSDSAAESLER